MPCLSETGVRGSSVLGTPSGMFLQSRSLYHLHRLHQHILGWRTTTFI